ncbi:MAG: stage II sporulation protein M [bacterium]|nr:stage II sporulation protein M [bacterium]
MKIGTLTNKRQADWDRLESLVKQAKGRPERLPAPAILELGRLYRSAIADLSRMRAKHPSHPATHEVAGLVARARPLVYRSGSRRPHPIRFMTTDYWRLAMARPAFLAVAAGVLFGTSALGWVWAVVDTSAAIGMVPGEFAGALDPAGGTDMGADLAMQAEFSAFLIANNVTVAILSFAVGVMFCVPTVYVLATNGITLGVIAGALVSGGSGAFFLELAAAHGILELSCIVVSAAAGLRLGWALVGPGDLTRRDALVAEARPAVLMTLGSMLWLVVAGIIEAFVSRSGFAALPMTIVGLFVGGLFWFMMWSRGSVVRSPNAV